MFKPIHNEYTNTVLGAPKDWDIKKDGECMGLPVHRDEKCYYSWWAVDWKNRLKILFGRPIRLTVISYYHPPLSLDAEK